MNTVKKRVAQVLAGVVGMASVATAGVALAANGDRSGSSPSSGKTPTVVSTTDRSGHEGSGEVEQGDDHGNHHEAGDDHGNHHEAGDDHGQHAEPGDDHGNHHEAEGENHHGDNSGPGGNDDGQHGDNSGQGGSNG